MKYLSLDIIDASMHPYPAYLNCIKITMRGTKNLFDIFFSASDVESSFGICLPNQIDFTWINTPSGKEKYLSYPTIKKMLFQLREEHKHVEPYLAWIDSLLFSNNRVKPFFNCSYSNTPTDEDTFSDIDDTSSVGSFESTDDTNYLVTALQHKVDQLEHKLEIKNKDIDILDREIKLRDKEIEILQLKLSIPIQSDWI